MVVAVLKSYSHTLTCITLNFQFSVQFSLKSDTQNTQAYVINCFDSDLTVCFHYCLYLRECLVVIKTMLLFAVTLQEET